nr:DNA polymerase III subunit chi [Pseudomonas matsuisoli]
MENSNDKKSGQLLDDLKSIRDLLDKYQLEPPLLTESAEDDIPVLSEVVAKEERPAPAPAAPVAQPTEISAPVVKPERPAPTPQRIDAELRKTAQLILQDVIDDFVPQIEAELKRRLEARMKELL